MIQKTVYYIGGYEKEIRDNHIYHRIQIGDVAIVEKVDDNAESIHYTLRDHLGSLIATVSDTGTIKRLFYDPWGKRLNLPVLEAQPITLFDLASFLTPRGFTGHEHLDNVGLIHMNGRVYDPEIARFVSADPILSAPTYLQSYNRYSYVWNNPLRFTDPNGFEPHGTGTDGYDSHPNYDHDNNRWDHDKDHSKENKKWDQKQKIELERETQRIAKAKAIESANRLEAIKLAEIARIAQARKDAALAQQKELARQAEIGKAAQQASQRETEVQRAFRLAGDVEGYYKARITTGDAYAARALMVVQNEYGCCSKEKLDKSVMALANFGLHGTAFINGIEVSTRDVQLRLMNAHADAVANDNQGVPGLLNPQQVAIYHHQVFRQLDLPRATFGGTPVTGFVWEANVWSGILCKGCDSQ